MKKIISLMLIGIMIITSAAAQPKSSDKALWKIAKKEAKLLQKEGWKVDGSMPLENLLFNHSQYLQPIITQYFIDNKSEIWLLFLIAHSKR